MRGIRTAPRLTALLAGVMISLLAPAAADAAATKYAPNQTARDFNQSAGGWTGSAEPDALCILPGVICPTVDNAYQASGGAEGGYIETSIGSVASTTLATNSGVWTSPAFKYRGAGGKRAKSLRFTMQMKSELGDLLAVPGNSATFEASIVPARGGQGTSLIPTETIEDESQWANLTGTLSPGALQVGQRYSIQVKTTFETIATVIPAGSVGYDDIVLTARGPRKGGGGNGGGPVGKQITKQISNTFIIRGRSGKTRVGCPRSIKPGKCKLRITGLQKRKGPKVTKTKRVSVGAAKHKVVRLKVIRKRRAIARRGRMFVQVKFNTPKGKGKVVKRVKVRSRR